MQLLLVDDEFFVRERIQKQIDWKALGIDAVRTAENGLEALDVARDFKPDILLTDVRMMGDARQVERIVMLLSRFYKRCLNQGEEYSTLSQELELTQAYMSIQEIRYSGKIRFVQEVAPELMHCSIPHIVLQPIVENAIHHGIMNNPNQEGTISIRGEKKGDLLLLTVSDDGAGMTEERLHQLNDGLDLQYSMSQNLPQETLKMAMTIITTGPIILLYPFIQRYFVKGLTIGAVKG